jgi:hypothetical protein
LIFKVDLHCFAPLDVFLCTMNSMLRQRRGFIRDGLPCHDSG